jgi:hypothetical protein
MKTVLAMLAPGPYAAAVLNAAGAIGELTGSTVEAIHVGDGSPNPLLAELARDGDVHLRLIGGDVEAELLHAAAAPEVVVVVVGARRETLTLSSPGDIALAVMKRTEKPVVVVPCAVALRAGPIRKVLLPFEDRRETSGPVTEALSRLVVSEVELDVVHVFTDESVPAMLDRPVRDLEVLGQDFLARHVPDDGHITFRTGSVPGQIVNLCHPDGVDLVVLGWSRNASAGRAEVVKAVLGDASVPVLLIPLGIEVPRDR